MRQIIKIFILFLISTVILFVYTGCTLSPGDDVAGTGSQAGNGKVVATVLYQDESPAAGADVFIRKKDFLKDTTDISSARIPDAVTDSEGTFTIDSVDPGDYFIEINDGIENAVLVECIRESTTIGALYLGSINIQPVASFTGKVDLDNIPNTVAVYIQLYGLEHAKKVDASGQFTFSGMPAGTHTLRILSSDSALGIIDSETVIVDPAENYDAGTFRLPFEFWRDTLVVRAILDTNGKENMPVAAVTTIKNGRITELDLNHKGITVIPEEIEELRLTHLHLGENFIDFIPPEIGKLSSLVHLGLMKNRIPGLPGTLCNLKKLKHLDLSENQIGILPLEIGKLSSLIHLGLRKNRLSRLPKSIGNLTGLEVLDLSSNELDALPLSITNLEELDFLSVNFNKLISVPPEIELWIDTYSTDKEWKVTQESK